MVKQSIKLPQQSDSSPPMKRCLANTCDCGKRTSSAQVCADCVYASFLFSSVLFTRCLDQAFVTRSMEPQYDCHCADITRPVSASVSSSVCAAEGACSQSGVQSVARTKESDGRSHPSTHQSSSRTKQFDGRSHPSLHDSGSSLPTANAAAADAFSYLVSSPRVILDSGCTSHMLPFRRCFIEYMPEENDSSVNLAGGGHQLSIRGRGSTCLVSEALHVPDLGEGLLSVSKFDKEGYSILFHNGRIFSVLITILYCLEL